MMYKKFGFVLLVFLLCTGCDTRRDVFIHDKAPTCAVEHILSATDWWEQQLDLNLFNVIIVDKMPTKIAPGTIHMVFKEHNAVDGTFRNNVAGHTSAHMLRTEIELEIPEKGKPHPDSACYLEMNLIVAHELGHHFRLKHLGREKGNLMNGDGKMGWYLTHQQKRKARRKAHLWPGTLF